jgi:hypothetical protein
LVQYVVGGLVGAVSAAFQTFMNNAATAFTTVLRIAADAAARWTAHRAGRRPVLAPQRRPGIAPSQSTAGPY